MLGGSTQIQLVVHAQDASREILAEDFTRNRPKSNKKPSASRSKIYRLASGRKAKIPAASSGQPGGQIGITVWHLRPAQKTDSGARMLLTGDERADFVAQRANSDAPLQRDARVRLSIESVREGFLYVIDRELFADGSTGPAMLIFPRRKMRGGDNKVRPGRLIDIPGQNDEPNYFTATPSRKDQVGELLSVLVTAEPLDLPLSDIRSRVSASDLANWEKRWGSGAQKFEMVDGAGTEWTKEEKEAAAPGSGRRLRQDEPAPQTVFRLPEGKDDGLLVSVTLHYQRPKPRGRR